MKFNLFYPNISRKRLLLVLLTAWLGSAWFLLVKSTEPAGIGLLIAMPIIGLVWNFFPKLSERIFWCPFRVMVATDGIAWQKPADEQPARYEFADINTYRFVSTKNSMILLFYLKNGVRIQLECLYTDEYASFQRLFEQAIHAYNRENPGAKLTEATTAFERFFARRISTYVLLVILAVDVLLAVWGTRSGAVGEQYAPLVLTFPYFLVWISFGGKRK